MPSRWVPSTEAEIHLLTNLALGFNEFAEFAKERVRQTEAGLEKYHYVNRRKPRAGHYVDTIQQATYLNGHLVGGVDVRGAARAKGDSIHSWIYTTSFLGHMLELTGAAPHDIPITDDAGNVVAVVSHPGFTRRPHFVPGILSAVSAMGVKVRGKVVAT